MKALELVVNKVSMDMAGKGNMSKQAMLMVSDFKLYTEHSNKNIMVLAKKINK
jgi:hypothetical protein